jgi:hypothetical protein
LSALSSLLHAESHWPSIPTGRAEPIPLHVPQRALPARPLIATEAHYRLAKQIVLARIAHHHPLGVVGVGANLADPLLIVLAIVGRVDEHFVHEDGFDLGVCLQGQRLGDAFEGIKATRSVARKGYQEKKKENKILHRNVPIIRFRNKFRNFVVIGGRVIQIHRIEGVNEFFFR